jgi:hypothetical protein
MHTGSESAHKLLELLITKTIVSGKGRSASVRIPYNELAAAFGKPQMYETDLQIEISLSWEAPEEF